MAGVPHFVLAEPAPSRLAAGLYVPKERYGAAVHAVLLRDEAALSLARGGPILQHEEVQREFPHFVGREHRFRQRRMGNLGSIAHAQLLPPRVRGRVNGTSCPLAPPSEFSSG